MDDDLKKAELRGYGRGYAAGKKRKNEDRIAERMQRERQAFLERAFIAALPACVNSQGWTAGNTPITNVPDRTKLAWDFAEAALKHRRYAP